MKRKCRGETIDGNPCPRNAIAFGRYCERHTCDDPECYQPAEIKDMHDGTEGPGPYCKRHACRGKVPPKADSHGGWCMLKVIDGERYCWKHIHQYQPARA